MGIPVAEKQIQRDIDRVYKYNLLKGLQYYLQKTRTDKKAYSVDEMLKEIEPYVKYYENFNIRNEALEYYEQRLQSIFDNEVSMRDLSCLMTLKLKAELADENSQVALFSDNFYSVEQWCKEKGKLGLETKDDQLQYNEEFIRRYIRYVKRLHNSDRDNQTVRQESLGQSITVQDNQPSLIRETFKDQQPLYVQAMIPVLRERYQCTYDHKKEYKPSYLKLEETLISEDLIFGILTPNEAGYIPPVTLAKKEGSSDVLHNVDTYFFESLNPTGLATCSYVYIAKTLKVEQLD